MGKRKDEYTLDDGTIQWARNREHQLRIGLQEMGWALEQNEMTIEAMMDGADGMDDQPESDRLRSIAQDMKGLLESLQKLHYDAAEDRKALIRAIKKYDERKEAQGA